MSCVFVDIVKSDNSVSCNIWFALEQTAFNSLLPNIGIRTCPQKVTPVGAFTQATSIQVVSKAKLTGSIKLICR